MNKSELLAAAAKQSGETAAATARVVDAVLATITKELRVGRDVSVTGFGRFHTVKRSARKGRNPRTGETVKIPAMRVPRFAPGQTLRNAVDRRRKK